MGKEGEKRSKTRQTHEENVFSFPFWLVVTGETHETTTVKPNKHNKQHGAHTKIVSISLAFHFIRERNEKIVSQLIHRPSERTNERMVGPIRCYFSVCCLAYVRVLVAPICACCAAITRVNGRLHAIPFHTNIHSTQSHRSDKSVSYRWIALKSCDLLIERKRNYVSKL